MDRTRVSEDPSIIVNIADDAWRDAGLADVEDAVVAAVSAALRHENALRAVEVGTVEIGVRLTGDDDIRALNREWRGQDKATNVLAFALDAETGVEGVPVPLGDIVVAFETCRREAGEEGKPLADHLRHLVVHGTLHLLGYDHEDAGEADTMEAAERRILATMGVPDPYAETEAA